VTEFSNKIIKWHLAHGRKNLPWQGTTDPYSIWLSEIMLQQTQVATVIPYYQRFMSRFPTIESLASADIDEVLHLWTGLGYYARGRNLHKAAKQVVEFHQGSFPKTLDEVMALSGIGRSTAGAILSFAFSLRHPILDGNVKRVLSRVFGVGGWYGKRAVADELWLLADEHTPNKDVSTYTQAIMDFGATLCTRSKPNCIECPMQKKCIAFQENRISELPGKKPKKAIPSKSCVMLIIRNTNNHILLLKRPATGIWGGLWVPPQIDTSEFKKDSNKDITSINNIVEVASSDFGIAISNTEQGQAFRHTFSHYHLDIQPIYATETNNKSHGSQVKDHASLWLDLNKPLQIGLPAPIKKLLESIHHSIHN
jgi:A/G-specific adenine glycosylase